jgi:type IV pilus assembly protein PilC
MVKAGEQGGSLADSLKTVATQMENSYLLTKRVRGALIYPGVIICLMIGIAILMFTYVIPTLMKTFIDLHVTLPWTTQILLNISDVVRGDGLWLLLGAFVIAYGYYRWSHSKSGKSIIDKLLLKIPIIGKLIKEVNTARAARTLSSLLESGVEVVESMNITGLVVQNVHFRNVLLKAGEAIGKGELLSKVFAEHTDLYPVFLVEMMSVGEESGKMSEMLVGVAQYYEDDINQKTKDMSTVIEPFIMIFIAAGVGFFAVAMISPMYSLVNAI